MKLLERLKRGNWKDFLREIAIIVIGVLIALAANEWADDWNWQRKVQEGELKLRREAANNFKASAEQAVVAPCVDRQLDILGQRVLASGETLDPAPLIGDELGERRVYRLPYRPFPATAWEALQDSGTSSHLDDQRLETYALLYTVLDAMREGRNRAAVLSNRSRILASPIPLDPSTRATLLGDLSEQAGYSRTQALMSTQVMRVLQALGHAPDPAAVDRFLDASATVQYCRAHGLELADWRVELDKLMGPAK